MLLNVKPRFDFLFKVCLKHFSFYEKFRELFSVMYISVRGPGSSVGIVTDYGMDDPGSNPGGYEIFRP